MSRPKSEFDRLIGNAPMRKEKRSKLYSLKIAVAGEYADSLPLVIGAAVLLSFGAYNLAISPWSVGPTLRHWLAAPNCSAARAMMLDEARRGQPGYYNRHDKDRDGIACERYPGY